MVKDYEVFYVDCVGSLGKNSQRLNTIEICYYVNVHDMYVIEYSFHSIDFDLWKQVISIHKDLSEASLYQDDTMIEEGLLENTRGYYTFQLRSKSPNLYRNINLILYLKKGEWDNRNEMMNLNLWEK